MFRPLLLGLAFLSTPALAADHYRAELAAPTTQARFVARDMVWRCAGESCAAGESASRPAIVCSSLVKEVGPLRAFAVQGQPLAEEELAKCNSRRR